MSAQRLFAAIMAAALVALIVGCDNKPALQALPEVNDKNCMLANIQKIEDKGSRVIPSVWRLIWTFGGLMVLTVVLPSNTGMPAFDALGVFSTWYPVGVMLLIFASWPLGRMLRARTQERGK